jgi:Mce-associated membrane protein
VSDQEHEDVDELEEPPVAARNADPPPETDPDAQPHPSRPRLVLAACLLVALPVLAVLCLVLVGPAWRANQRETSRDAALQAARQEAINLVTVNWQSAPSDVAHVLGGATGPFHQEFELNADTFTDIVKKAQVMTTGQVMGAGLDQFAPDTARALVAVHSTVRNTQTPNGEDRDYRIAENLRLIGDRWLVERVEFVP